MTADLSTDISIEDSSWSRKRLGLQKFSNEILLFAWKQIKGRSKARPRISIVYTNDNEIKKLNKKFRTKNKPTNVLSFQIWPDTDSFPAGDVPIGDIVFAYETINREAKEQGLAFKDHLTHLLIHGFLHICGYDHMKDDEAEIMEALEIKILRKLGIKNPYADA